MHRAHGGVGDNREREWRAPSPVAEEPDLGTSEMLLENTTSTEAVLLEISEDFDKTETSIVSVPGNASSPRGSDAPAVASPRTR